MQPTPTAALLGTAVVNGLTLAEKWLSEGTAPDKIKPRLKEKLSRVLAPECQSQEDFDAYLHAYLVGADHALEASEVLPFTTASARR